MPRRYPETNVFFRRLTAPYPVIERAEGCWLYDADGTEYLDGCSGAFVANVGHGVREIADAMAAQAGRVAYVSGAAMTHEAVEQFAFELAALVPGDLDRVYPLSSGSDAIEAALKLARQYWVDLGRSRKHKVVALTPAYHGNTLLALSASAREHYKMLYRDWLIDVVRIDAPYAYRCGCGGQQPYCDACSGRALETALAREDPETVAAFIVEPVGGSSTGASVPPPEYFRRVRAICDANDVLLVADEILVGAGRTGTWSALEPYGVTPDIAVYGKGIAGGYAPLAAVVAPRRLVDVVAAGAGALVHAQTFSHHPVSCAAGAATIRYMRQHRLVERCAELGPRFHRRLEALRTLPHVGDIRGRGLLAGIELVEDVDTTAPFPRAARVAETFTAAAREVGLIVWPNVGHADGTDGDLIMLAPPLVIDDDEIEQLVTRFGAAMERTIVAIGAERR